MEERNEIYDLVGIEEIAKMGDADLEAARHWVSEDGFPSPIMELPTGARWIEWRPTNISWRPKGSGCRRWSKRTGAERARPMRPFRSSLVFRIENRSVSHQG